jgi:2-oxoglutarate dehydrogenase E2 component (dihydrolipoamide succinyltransferase)
MKEQLIVPQIGESISEAIISKWLVQNMDTVEKDQDIVEIDSDKTTLTISAPAAGQIHIIVPEGTTVKILQLIAEIDTSVAFELKRKPAESEDVQPDLLPVPNEKISSIEPDLSKQISTTRDKVKMTPLANKIVATEGLDPEQLRSFVLKYKIGVEDVREFIDYQSSKGQVVEPVRSSQRKPMSPLRKKLASRLVAVKNQTAMLTTFNEVDMSMLIEIRNTYKNAFESKHGVKLGYMSFFAKACAIALKKFPAINAMIDNDDVVFFDYCDISIAVSTDKGLVVPIIRNVDSISLAQTEKEIQSVAQKARSFKLLPEDFEGGTFTITNGGVFGSLLSTPIINPPQAAILGMHTIQERPIAINGQVVVRPMMYIALSYDHRIIDGKESVGFVVEVKRLLENPTFMFLETSGAIDQLLEL